MDEQQSENQKPQETEKTPEDLEIAEFEQRLAEIDEAEIQSEKEKRFQIYRLVKKFGLKDQELNTWRNDNPLGIELAWLSSKPYIYKNLSLGEYEQAAENVQTTPELHRKVVSRALLWPQSWKQESDFLRGPAGIVASLAEAILRTSGFDQVMAITL